MSDAGRRRQLKTSALLGFLILLFVPCPATALTGSQLNENCQSKNKTAFEVACVAYILGLTEGLFLGQTLTANGREAYCPPTGGLESRQARLIIEKFLRDHPERLHEHASFLAAESLLAAFPCKKK
jgi:hypothetical protein